MIRQKLRARRGLSLAETLAALGVFAILSIVLVCGVNAAWKVYRKAVTASEARTLQSTLAQALSDELRYARNVQSNASGAVVFDSETFGADVQVYNNTDGRLRIGTATKAYELLGAKAYTGGLCASAGITYDSGTGLFTIELTVTQAKLLPDGLKTKLTVQALNAPAATAP